MFIPPTIEDKYKQIISEIDQNDVSDITIRDKYIQLKRILERVCKDITSDESLQFPSLFSRLVYISQKYNLPRSVEWNLQNIRVKSSFLQKDLNNVISKTQYTESLETVRRFLCIIFNINNCLSDNFIIYDGKSEFHQQKSSYIRIQVIDIDIDKSVIEAETKELSNTPIKIRYNVKGVNDIFNTSIERIWIGAQLNISDYKIDSFGYYIPKFIVLEPDYLIDTSAMAECFQNFSRSYLHYFRRKFEKNSNSKHLLLGNLANYFLDEFIFCENPNQLNFDIVFQESFRQKPFEYTSCSEIKKPEDFRSFMVKARSQFENIKRVITHDFQKNKITPEKCTLEPSFFCEKFGFQGRLDLLELPQNQNDFCKIIELKSGGLPFPKDDPTKVAINHEVQTAIYRLIIESVFGIESRKISASILYSASENIGENLRSVATYNTLEKEIINTRNLIVATEHDLYFGKKEEVEKLFHNICNLDNYGRVPDFFSKTIIDFEKIITTTTDLEQNYFFRYITFLSRELYIQKVGDDYFESSNSTASLWNTEFLDRKDAFDLISNLKIDWIEESSRDMKIMFRRNETSEFINFREGEICILYPHQESNDTALTNQILKGTIVDISYNHVLLRFRYKQKNRNFFDTYKSWVIEHDRLDHTYNNMYKSLYTFIGSSIDKRSLLLGIKKPTSIEKVELKSISNVDLSDIEIKQNTVLKKAIDAQDYFLIVGPPGTGKTSIFARRLIEHYYNNTEDNILIIAYTNRAVDELCESINRAFDCSTNECDNYIRIGTELSCGENYRHRLLQNISASVNSRDELRNILSKQRIFIGTLAAIVGKPEIFDIKRFNIAIIDEASQILEPHIIGLLPQIDKFIMIGDHKQLSTITLQSQDKSLVKDNILNIIELYDCRESLFERLFRICKNKGWTDAYDTLIYQGRMHEELSAFPNKYFYDGMLRSSSDWQSKKLISFSYDKSNIYQSLISQNRIAFINCSEVSTESDKINHLEAKIAVELAKAITEIYKKNYLQFNPQKTLGIITPYRNQIALIKHYISELGIEELQNIMIDTVERFQGSQREVIILSFCMNKSYQLDLFSNMDIENIVDRKLNVAITRARQQLFLIGNQDILTKNPIYKQYLDLLKIINIKNI